MKKSLFPIGYARRSKKLKNENSELCPNSQKNKNSINGGYGLLLSELPLYVLTEPFNNWFLKSRSVTNRPPMKCLSFYAWFLCWFLFYLLPYCSKRLLTP